MIFVTVGTQLPFDRLIAAVDHWAGLSGRADVFAQTCGGTYRPAHMMNRARITPAECREYFARADIVVAHAGMGTIISAIEAGKPLVIVPRRMDFGEHRNDHQVATCERFCNLPNVFVANMEEEIPEKINAALAASQFDATTLEASEELLGVIGAFLADTQSLKDVDGVICFGGVDWWYHNRGHYDIQMMREFSRVMPVLYVNSIGMRTPSVGEGKVFFKRVARKLKSWTRGLSIVRENFGVLSPFTVPLLHRTSFGKAALAEQVLEAGRRMGIRNPLVWVACPPAAEVIDRIPARGLVYQRTDKMEHFPGVDTDRIRGYDLDLKSRAALTLFCSTSVYDEERYECRKAAFVDHGVDYDTFSSAPSGEGPEDVREIARPRIGFVGGIDIHTFDPALFVRAAEAMPDCSFVMVGGCSLPPDWCTLGNVHFLGRKPYEEVASYMAACDVLIMPWNRSPWIKACNPVKLKEYLAAGRPVVSTPFDELSRYSDYVTVAEDADGFVQGIRSALESPPDASRLRERVVRETWAAKAAGAFSAIEESGIRFRSSFSPVAAESEGNIPMQSTEISPTRQTDPAVAPRGYWRKSLLIATALLALVGFWVTADAWRDIYRLGTTDEESSHVLLAIPAALWIAWTRKTYAAGARRTGAWLGPTLVALGWLLFAYGDVQLFQSIWHFGAICIVVGCIVTMVGREAFLRLWPAFAVLMFLIPVPAILRMQIAPPMQTVTAQITAYLLQTFGEPVTLSGKVLVVNNVTVGIAEACNGIRMVFALALVCFFYAFSTDLSARTRLLIILASPVVAIAVNIVRLVPTVWLYGHAEVGIAEQFHDLMGWAMMPVALFGLIAVRGIFHWALKDDPEAPA